MFVANVLTVWVEAIQLLLEDHPNEDLRGIEVVTEYPQAEVNYPGIWVNFTMQGDVKNVGIGHVEYSTDETTGDVHEVYRWHFGGFVELTLGAMSNLERALLIDALTKDIAVARVDQNREGVLREHVERSDLIGQNVTWESFTISGFGEAQGTPWGTDDVIYEATVTLVIEGEVVLDPEKGALVPLSAVTFAPQLAEEGALPIPGTDGWL